MFSRLAWATFVIAGLLGLDGCNSKQIDRGFGTTSPNELSVTEENPFAAESRLTGVWGEPGRTDGDASFLSDSFRPTNEKNSCDLDDPEAHAPDYVRHCTADRYETELKEAMQAAADDTTKKTVVVRYSLSFGTPFDDTARFAFQRSILRLHDDGYTPIPVAPQGSLDWDDYYGSRAKHYFANHKRARTEYIKGLKCFFNTVTVDLPPESGPVMTITGTWDHSLPATPAASKSYVHTNNILYYGDAYPENTGCTGDCLRKYLSPRLFKTNDLVVEDIKTTLRDWVSNNPTNLPLSEFIRRCPSGSQAQIIPLYVADIREQRLGLPDLNGVLIRRDFASSAQRRYEYAANLKKLMNLRPLFLNRHKVEVAYGRSITTGGYTFEPYVGAAQLVDNLIFSGTNGTVTSTQYTPIVLDLPVGDTPEEYQKNRHILTSSADWGTFFNLANLGYRARGAAATVPLSDLHHLTAWTGGRVKSSVKDPITGGTLPNGESRKELVSSDGFLVVPEADTDTDGNPIACPNGDPKYRVPRGESLFGSFAKVDGRIQEYTHGFAKLRDWINRSGTAFPKDCTVPSDILQGAKRKLTDAEIKKRYFGPWDTQAYSALKVWTDVNRDGFVDSCSEISSLANARVAAMSVCSFVYYDIKDGELIPAEDRYGNKTYLRAGFLVSDAATPLMPEAEILTRLKSGKTGQGADAEFRVAIDLLFQTKTDLYLEDADPDSITSILGQ